MPFEMGQNPERPCKLVPKPIMNVCMLSFGFFYWITKNTPLFFMDSKPRVTNRIILTIIVIKDEQEHIKNKMILGRVLTIIY